MRVAKIGVDIGGTFTDIVFLDDAGGVETLKVLSSPPDYAEAIIDGVLGHYTARGVVDSTAPVLAHATTVATNAVLENKGAKTALVTTRGFRDVVEFRRLRIPVMYDLQYEKPRELVQRRDRHVLDERTNADGTIARPVDGAEAREVGRRIAASGVESVAICLLNAYRDATNEAAALAALRAVLPDDVYVCSSAEILPEIREYERTSTTIVSAYVGPLVSNYLQGLEGRLRARGLAPEILIMKSGGGVATVAEALRSPAAIIESGPAAGVIAAARLARDLDARAAISFDMGGTTAKAALIEEFEPAKTSEYEVGAGINISSKLVKGGGYPIRLPFIDVSEIGAGGGSIIRLDAATGTLRVGPDSAGAMPGPACYGRGGTQATVTDALAVLGYLNPHHLVGGALPIDRDRAASVLAEQVAVPLGVSVDRAALGALDIATASMVRAVKAVTTYQGRDPREHDLIAFGGNGPAFATRLADALGITRVVIPANPGVFTAVGLLDAAYELDRVASVYTPFARLDRAALAAIIARLRAQILADSQKPELVFKTVFDMKYKGQAYEISIPVDDLDGDPAAIRARFNQAHQRTYGHAEPEHPLDLVNIRLTATARQESGAHHAPPAQPVTESTRAVVWSSADGPVETRVLNRRPPGLHGMAGPLIIEEYDSTILVPPGWAASAAPMNALALARS